MNRHEGHGAERDERDERGGKSAPEGCATFAPLLEAFHHHALDLDTTRSVAEHAAGCAACGAAMERFAATDRLIAAAPMALPGPELRQQLAARIAATRVDRSPRTSFPMPFERKTVVRDMNHDANNEPWTTSAMSQRQTRQSWQRVNVWLGTLAAILVVALLGGALLSRAHGTPGQLNPGLTSGGFTPTSICPPAKIKATLPAHSEFASLAFVSPNEGWAVGGTIDPTQLTPTKALILHYYHCAWTPISFEIPNAGLSSVSMGSATDGWAVGTTPSNAPLALHYANGAWKQVPPPGAGELHGLFSYASVHMLSADEGWIVVNLQKDTRGYLASGLLHLVNGRWSLVAAPFPIITTVLPVAPGEAWVVGSASKVTMVPVLYHYHAGAWTPATLRAGVVVDTLRMVSPTNIWASGHIGPDSGWPTDQSPPAVLHYDGSQWRQVAVSASGHPQVVEAFDGSTSWAFTLQPVNGPTARWFTAITQYQRDGAWRTLANPPVSLFHYIDTLTRVEPDTYWVVGYYEVTQPNPNGQGSMGYDVPVLLYFANGAWHQYGR